MGPDEQISHADIYHKLGALEAKMDAIVTRVTEYSADLANVFTRLRELETRTSWALGAVAALSLVLPVAIAILGANFDMRIIPSEGIESSK